jgi:hypothetical protein
MGNEEILAQFREMEHARDDLYHAKQRLHAEREYIVTARDRYDNAHNALAASVQRAGDTTG